MDDLTVREIEVIIPLIDLGIKSAGLRVFEKAKKFTAPALRSQEIAALSSQGLHPTAAASEPE